METFIQQSLMSGELHWLLPLAVLATGILTSLSPCVYPLLPITVGTLGAFNNGKTLQAFFNAMIYVSGLAMVYGLLGLLAAMTGQLFGAVASHPVTQILVANVLLFFSAWMMGWVNLSGWYPQGDLSALKPYRRCYLFALGALSGLVAAPCTSPVLGMLLMYVAAKGSPVTGAVLLIIFAYGMSTLLILAGTFGGLLQRLPRSSRWLTLIKSLLALMLLAAAQYLLLMAGKTL